MYHLTFGNSQFNTAILIKHASLSEPDLKKEYLTPLEDMGFDTSGSIAFSLTYDKKKPSAACRKDYLAQLLPELDKLGITDILCLDSEYYKTLVKQTKAESDLGYVKPCRIKGFEHMNIIYGFNHSSFFYNPDNRVRNKLALGALKKLSEGTYVDIGTNVLKEVKYPLGLAEIKAELDTLLLEPVLAMDIEAYSLKHYDAGIGTISFSKDKSTAVVFPVDSVACEPYEIQVWDKKDKKYKTKIAYHKQVKNEPVRALLKSFFEQYKGKHIWHNASYDVTVLIYQLWMDNIIDRKGLLTGWDVMIPNMECSQVVTYLATNSCAGNHLGLKRQAHEFVGNYAIEVTDIRLQPLPDLLKYNAIDTVATVYVWEKNYPIMVQDEQESLYQSDCKPYLADIIDMQLTGMCLDKDKVLIAEKELQVIRDTAKLTLGNTPLVKQFISAQIDEEVKSRNLAYKNKVIDASDAKFKLNLNSGPQMQVLLYEFFKLPVIDLTDKKQPATGRKTLEKLVNHTDDPECKAVLESLIEYALTAKILSSFIPAFKEAPLAPDGYHYLFGSFKLGGTVSGRLSSSNP